MTVAEPPVTPETLPVPAAEPEAETSHRASRSSATAVTSRRPGPP